MPCSTLGGDVGAGPLDVRTGELQWFPIFWKAVALLSFSRTRSLTFCICALNWTFAGELLRVMLPHD
jgi:hypothetical protein